MKISKSKQELARIISENGGWRDGAEWAAQDSSTDDFPLRVCFYANRPVIQKGESRWVDGNCRMIVGSVYASHQIKNWHQTILSRDEYFYLHPAPDAKHEFCESVMRSIPEPSDKPTIEQLAADYRNRKDYADRKRQEADAAKDDADEALRKLELAGEEIGLIVTPITANQESELAIEVKVGDEVECVEPNTRRDKYIGMIGILIEIDERDQHTPYLVDFGERAEIWCHEVKFIRRP